MKDPYLKAIGKAIKSEILVQDRRCRGIKDMNLQSSVRNFISGLNFALAIVRMVERQYIDDLAEERRKAKEEGVKETV
jgi:hypothetical protein